MYLTDNQLSMTNSNLAIARAPWRSLSPHVRVLVGSQFIKALPAIIKASWCSE